MSPILKRFGLCALIAFGLATGASAQDGPAARAFADGVLDRIEALRPDIKAASQPDDPLQIVVTEHPIWEGATINLHRIYAYCATVSEADCESELVRLDGMLMQDVRNEAAEDLRVVVRDAAYMAGLRETLGEGSIPPHRQIGDDLFAILAFDNPDSIALASPDSVDGLGISRDEVWTLAIEQTNAIIPPLPLGDQAVADEGLFIFNGEEYTASVLLDTRGWSEIWSIGEGNLVIAVISDQLVTLANLPEESQRVEFAQVVAQSCAEASRCVSPRLYTFKDGYWVIAD